MLWYRCLFVLYKVSKSRSFQFFGDLTHRIETDEKIVALTFDDGPTTYTNEVLSALKDKKVKATFYVTGQGLEAYPDIGKALVEEGHELGNHSYSHPRFLLKSQSFIKQEIEQTNTLIRETGFSGPITFRPPFGKKLFSLPWYLMRQGIRTVTWDIEPDSYSSERDFIVDYTLQNTKSGSIILLHPFCKSCGGKREAIPLIIDQLQIDGFRSVTISELIN